MKILVTGATGLLGKSLIPKLEEDHEVFAPKRYECNLFVPEQVNEYLFRTKPDTVIHLGGKVGGIIANMENQYTFLYENAVMGLNILESCRKHRIKNFVATSSTCCYPNVETELTEDMVFDGVPEATNAGYSYGKRVLINAIKYFNEQYKKQYSYLILSNLYSSNDHRDERAHFVSKAITKTIDAKRKKLPQIIYQGHPEPIRQYLFASDCGEIIKRHVELGVTDSYNVTYCRPMSIGEMAKAIADAAEYEGEIVFTREFPAGMQKRIASLDLFHKYHPDFHFTPFRTGVATIIREWSK